MAELTLAGRNVDLTARLTVMMWADPAAAIRELEAPDSDGAALLSALAALHEARSDFAIVDGALAKLRAAQIGRAGHTTGAELEARRDGLLATLATPLPDPARARAALNAVRSRLIGRPADQAAQALLRRFRAARAAYSEIVEAVVSWPDAARVARAHAARDSVVRQLVLARQARFRREQRVAEAQHELDAATDALAALDRPTDPAERARLAAAESDFSAARAAAVAHLGRDPGDTLEHMLSVAVVPPVRELEALADELRRAGVHELTPRYNTTAELAAVAAWCDDQDAALAARARLEQELAEVNELLATAAQLSDGDDDAQIAALELAWVPAASRVRRAEKAVARTALARWSGLHASLRAGDSRPIVVVEPTLGLAPEEAAVLYDELARRAGIGPVVVVTSDPVTSTWARSLTSDLAIVV